MAAAKTEYERYKELGPAYEKAWRKMDDHLKTAPSLEVFRHGYEEAKGIRYVAPEAYAAQVVAEARGHK